MVILPLALAVPWAGAYRQDGRNASSQMQSNMRPFLYSYCFDSRGRVRHFI